uniref:AIG1-type G domain-containing protein n=1 Tax=Pygocentrus nattereri TaxID=42514 RepID=A0AAR2LTP1_PYGNA
MSSEILKNIVFSLHFCNRGPHAVLLVIRLDILFKEKQLKAIEGLLKHLGERAWNRTVVLFTHGDWLGDTPIEQHIESEGKELQQLVEKCGNRYHVLNNENWSDDTQVTELLEKIEEMVAANSGRLFQMDRKILQEAEEKRRAEEERVKERMMKVQKNRRCNQLQMGSTKHLSKLRIVLLGYRTAGKSSAGNTILNREEFELKTAAQCVKRQREVAGRHITVVEAPGWKFNESEFSSEVLKNIMFSLHVCIPGPHALLLVICLKFGFKGKQLKTIKGYLKHLSERVWSHTIVLFTHGDCLGDTPIEQHIESEGEDLQWLVEKCGNRYHVLNNKNRSDDTQVTELLEKIEEMVAANSGQKVQMEDERQIIEEGMLEGKVQDQRKKELIRSDIEPQMMWLSEETWEKSVGGSTLDTSVKRFDIDRAPSPAPSDLSLKTDWSMDANLNFSDNQRFKLENRPSSVLSYLSVETEYSAEHSFSLSETELFQNQRFGLLRGSSPVPNEASMKTDSSMNKLQWITSTSETEH